MICLRYLSDVDRWLRLRGPSVVAPAWAARMQRMTCFERLGDVDRFGNYEAVLTKQPSVGLPVCGGLRTEYGFSWVSRKYEAVWSQYEAVWGSPVWRRRCGAACAQSTTWPGNRGDADRFRDDMRPR